MTQATPETHPGAMELVAVLAGFMAGPVATPALIWLSLALELPLVVVIVLLVAMVLVSNWLSHIIIRIHEPG
ncbi:MULTISPECIES: hypothetical protein [Mycobacterium]|jgi:hypothetical protein|uniref:hypothetical protein n=1 Tax=Mycobacterium TaxID=1763 RepID=UPI0002529E68|nr:MULTISPECIES: hypothetical protein [Mycobacterium]AFC51975.1 hypothetical protein OCQ_04620 [Mycobacterium paraintracellulare]OSC26897.1 hypothetical protein B8W68_11235 [Mycobacterium paraintracellulare]WRU82808.1 hypothetical protein P6281_02240 [Mycobacterium sp. 5-140-3-2]WSE41043.1 hypothetical protein QGN28_23875 [Mycobacterium sp. 5-140-3-1]